MQVPILFGAPFSDISPSSRRSSRAWPPADRGRPATPSASDASDSNTGHKCCIHCCIDACHRGHDSDCPRNKKKRQGNNQGQRPTTSQFHQGYTTPTSSTSSSTKVATPLPQFHYRPGYPVMAAYPPDPIHSYIHPAHAQAAPPPPQPAETPREAPQTKCNCQQPGTTPEIETRNHCCCHSDDCRSEQSGYSDDVASESPTEAVAGFGYENPGVMYHYYRPLYLAIPFGTPVME